MPYCLVPNEVTSNEATIWVGGFNESPAPHRVRLTCNRVEHVVAPPWDRWEVAPGQRGLTYQRYRLTNLDPRTRYDVRLLVDGQEKSDASFTTLPDRLPTADETPFTVLLGSCFCRERDGAGAVGTTYTRLTAHERPAIKFLCGDQVYLDAPSPPRPWPWDRDPASLRGTFFRKYEQTWLQGEISRQGEPLSGFRQLLKNGANYFVSDDHEYWNNYPGWQPHLWWTWTKDREESRKTTQQLFRIFQAASCTSDFQVGRLSFLVLDTRYNRDDERTSFISDDDFETFKTWVAGLGGPGVLVLGQPLFGTRPPPFGVQWFVEKAVEHLDFSLSQYAQYEDFCRELMKTTHSIVVLSGDVHFGRVASCRLNSGVELVEILASPMSLVDDSSGGSWAPAADSFPANDRNRRVPQVPIKTVDSYRRTDNHFATIEFSASGPRVKLVAKAWPIGISGTEPKSRGVQFYVNDTLL